MRAGHPCRGLLTRHVVQQRVARDDDVAGRRHVLARDKAHGRRLTGAVRPEEAERLLHGDAEGEAAQADAPRGKDAAQLPRDDGFRRRGPQPGGRRVSVGCGSGEACHAHLLRNDVGILRGRRRRWGERGGG